MNGKEIEIIITNEKALVLYALLNHCGDCEYYTDEAKLLFTEIKRQIEKQFSYMETQGEHKQ